MQYGEPSDNVSDYDETQSLAYKTAHIVSHASDMGGIGEPSWSGTTSSDAVRSILAALLIREVMWGFMSASKAREIASAAIDDGCTHKDLETFKNVGKEGTYIGNIWRDLTRIFTWTCKRNYKSHGKANTFVLKTNS